MTRLQPPDPGRLGERTRAIYDAVKSRYGAVLEPIAVTALHPEVLEAYFGFEVAFARARQLPVRLRELVNLKAAALLGCPFCLDIGSSECRAAGVTEAMICDLPDFEASAAFDPAEKAALAYCSAMTRGRAEIDDAGFARLREHFSDAQIVELTAVVAWENYRSRFNLALGFTAHGFSQGQACALPERSA
jgi:AhpD family alkylhydroperoxidase